MVLGCVLRAPQGNVRPAPPLSLPLCPRPGSPAPRRWPLHGSDEAFSGMLARMPGLTSLDISCCGLEELPAALLHAAAPADSDSTSGSAASSEPLWGQQEADSGAEASPPPALLAGLEVAAAAAAGSAMGVVGQGPARGPRLLRLLAHGNQLEASAVNGAPEPELLWFPT